MLEWNLLSLGPAKASIKIMILKVPQVSWQVVAEFTTSYQVILKPKERLRSLGTTDNLFPWESSVINFLLDNVLHIVQLLWDFQDKAKQTKKKTLRCLVKSSLWPHTPHSQRLGYSTWTSRRETGNNSETAMRHPSTISSEFPWSQAILILCLYNVKIQQQQHK